MRIHVGPLSRLGTAPGCLHIDKESRQGGLLMCLSERKQASCEGKGGICALRADPDLSRYLLRDPDKFVLI